MVKQPGHRAAAIEFSPAFQGRIRDQKNRNGVASATREIRIFQASLTRRVSNDAILPGLERPG